jgi:hypothetical protein
MTRALEAQLAELKERAAETPNKKSHGKKKRKPGPMPPPSVSRSPRSKPTAPKRKRWEIADAGKPACA